MDRSPVVSGRPRIPLLIGQKAYIERAYASQSQSQARIAQHLDIAIPRVRRHLIEAGLYHPRPPQRSPEREEELSEAVQAYIDGERVVEICQTYNVNPAELYREIRTRGIPYRTQVNRETTSAAHTVLAQEVDDGQ